MKIIRKVITSSLILLVLAGLFSLGSYFVMANPVEKQKRSCDACPSNGNMEASGGKFGDKSCAVVLEPEKPRVCLEGKTNVDVTLLCKEEGKDVGDPCTVDLTVSNELNISKDRVELNCGETKAVKLSTDLDRVPMNPKVRMAAETIDCDCKDDQIELELDKCRVEVSSEKDEVCPDKTTTVSGEYICKKEECEDGFDWTVSGPFTIKTNNPSGKKEIEVKAKKDATGGEEGTVTATPKGCEEDCEKGQKTLTIKPCEVELSLTPEKEAYCPGKDEITATAELSCEFEDCGNEWTFKVSGPLEIKSQNGNEATIKVKEPSGSNGNGNGGNNTKTGTITAKVDDCQDRNCKKATEEVEVQTECTIELTAGKNRICPFETTSVTSNLKDPCNLASNCNNITFESSNPAVAKVDPVSGTVTPQKEGTTTITAKKPDQCDCKNDDQVKITVTCEPDRCKPDDPNTKASAKADTKEDNPHLFCVENRSGRKEGTIEFDTRLLGPSGEDYKQTIDVTLNPKNNRFPWLQNPQDKSFIKEVRIFDVSGAFRDPITVNRARQTQVVNQNFTAGNSTMTVKMTGPRKLNITKDWDQSTLGSTEDIDRIEVTVKSARWKFDLDMKNKINGTAVNRNVCGEKTGKVRADNEVTGEGEYAWLEMTAYRPQHEGGGLGGDPRYTPFQRTEVPESDEEDPKKGPGIRINCDDDNGNNTQDKVDRGQVIDENDLIEVTLEFEQASNGSGKLVLKRSGTPIRVWENRLKGQNNRIDFNNGEAELNKNEFQSGQMTVWVEWFSRNHGLADLTLEIKKEKTDEVVCEDIVTFHTFRTIVITLGGENNVPTVGRTNEDNDQGVFIMTDPLYEMGYDLHHFDEDLVLPTGRGFVFNEVKSAVNNKKQKNIVIFGYSHGGGSTHDLANLLNLLNIGNIVFTSYIDAIEQEIEGRFDPAGDTTQSAETDLPPGTAFHTNDWQPNPTTVFEILGVEFTVRGDRVPGANRNTRHPNENHSTIDNDTRVHSQVRRDFRGSGIQR